MLKLQYKDQRKAAIWLVDERYSIGKDPANDIVISEGSVSPFHAELSVSGDDVFVADMGSTTGTFVNGEQVRQRTPLKAKDVLKVDEIEFVLVDPKDELKGAVDTGATALTPALSNLSVAPSQKAAKATATSAALGESPWYLVVKTGTQMGTEFNVPYGKVMTIGRSSQADITLAGSHVSRQHAEVEARADSLHVRDLGSANGTYINRKKMLEGNVKNGDELRLDTITLTVKGPEAEEVVEAPAVASAQAAAPAASSAAAVAEKPKAAAVSKPAAAAPAAKPAPVASAAPAAEKSSSGVIIAGVVVVVAVGAAAAWLLM